MKFLKTQKTLTTVFVAALIVGAVFLYLNYEKTTYKQDETVRFNAFDLNITNVESNKLSLSKLHDFYLNVEKGNAELKKCDSRTTDMSLNLPERLSRSIGISSCEGHNQKINDYREAQSEIKSYKKDNLRLDVAYVIKSKTNDLSIDDVKISLVSPVENLRRKKFKHADFYKHEIKGRTRNDIEDGSLTKGLKRHGLVWADISQETWDIDMKVEHKDSIKTVKIKLN